MEDFDEKENPPNQQSEDEPSVSDQGITKNLAKKGINAIRGLGATGETAGEAATATAGAETAGGASAATQGLAGATAVGEASTGVAAAATAEGTTTAAAATAGGTGAGMGAAAVFVILFVFIVTIIATIGGGASVNAGIPTNQPPVVQPPPDTNPTCTSGDYLSCLSQQYNVKVQGTSDPKIIRFLFDTLSLPLTYPSYLRLFKTIGITIAISPKEVGTGDIDGAWAFVSGNKITLFQDFFTGRDSTQKQYLIHETGHAIANTDQGARLQAQLYNQVYSKGLDKSCFNANGVLKTYPVSSPNNKIHEIFAESVADTIVCNKNGPCGGWGGETIQNFSSTCANTASFIEINLLGTRTNLKGGQ